MGFFKKSSDYFNLIPEGIYNALISEVSKGENQVQGKYDKKDYEVVIVKFTLDTGRVVYNRYILNWKINTPIDRLLKAALGENVDDIDFDDLLEKKVIVEIKYNEKDGIKYANVSNVYPVSDDSKATGVNESKATGAANRKAFVVVTDSNELEDMIDN